MALSPRSYLQLIHLIPLRTQEPRKDRRKEGSTEPPTDCLTGGIEGKEGRGGGRGLKQIDYTTGRTDEKPVTKINPPDGMSPHELQTAGYSPSGGHGRGRHRHPRPATLFSSYQTHTTRKIKWLQGNAHHLALSLEVTSQTSHSDHYACAYSKNGLSLSLPWRWRFGDIDRAANEFEGGCRLPTDRIEKAQRTQGRAGAGGLGSGRTPILPTPLLHCQTQKYTYAKRISNFRGDVPLNICFFITWGYIFMPMK